MKKLFSKLFMVGALGLFAMSCGDDDNEVITVIEPNDPFDARINNNAADSTTATVFLSDIEDGIIDVLLTVSSTENMKRVYTTQNLLGQGEEKVDASDTFGVNDKGDGSIDLNSDLENGFQFSLDFTTNGLPTEGTLVYTFWTTSGKGDFRDIDKRLAEGPFTLTIDLGGTNPATLVREYSATILAAPLGDGSSETFMSLLDGELYRISEGEEFASFWDFGYYYGASGLASLASSARYPQLFDDDNNPDTPLVGISALTGTPQEELNQVYFALSNMTTADFETIEVSNDLNFVEVNETSDAGRINELEVGDVIEFEDNYGKKGLISVVRIQGTFGVNDFIELDIKVQP